MNPKKVLVRKYGGSSLTSVERIKAVARDILKRRNMGYRMVVVVSAMGRTTDELSTLALNISEKPARRELDMLLSVGERITMSLLTMALTDLGCDAISFTGSQCGLITDDSHNDARILEVRCDRVRDALAAGNVVVVAGFQGVSRDREITTLGRGGSDATAVALAAALGAQRCEILKDVEGLFTADPHRIDTAQCHDQLSYQQLEKLANVGCGVIHPQAIAYAKQHKVPLFIGSSFHDSPGTTIQTDSGIPANKALETRPRPLGLVLHREIMVLNGSIGEDPSSGISIAFPDHCDLLGVPDQIRDILNRAGHTATIVLKIDQTIHILLTAEAAEAMLGPLHDLFLD